MNSCGDCEHSNCSLHAHAPEMASALRKLTNELSDLQLQAVREGCGNSNGEVLKLRADEARALLAKLESGS